MLAPITFEVVITILESGGGLRKYFTEGGYLVLEYTKIASLTWKPKIEMRNFLFGNSAQGLLPQRSISSVRLRNLIAPLLLWGLVPSQRKPLLLNYIASNWKDGFG